MFLIQVTEARIEIKSGVSKKSGQPYSIHEQPVFVTLPNGERRRITLQHESDGQPLPVGDYTPKDTAGFCGDFGALAVSTRAKHWQPATPARK